MPNAVQAAAPNFLGERQGVSGVSLIKQRAGNMYARAVADTPAVE